MKILKNASEHLQPVSNCLLKQYPHFGIIFRHLGEKWNTFHVVFKFGCYPCQTFSKINFVNSIVQLTLSKPINPATAGYHRDLYKYRCFSSDASKILLSNTNFKRLRCNTAHKSSRCDQQNTFPCMLQISVHNTKKGIMSGE